MTTKLINILRTAANWIESDEVNYDWDSVSGCNCGILVKVANELNPNSSIDYPVIDNDGLDNTWSSKIEYCTNTNLPIPTIIQNLFDLGLTTEDIYNLEWLGNPLTNRNWFKDWDSRSRTNNDADLPQYPQKEKVVNYLRNWADDLENKLNKTNETKIN